MGFYGELGTGAKKKSKGIKFGSIPGELGTAFATPFFHPVQAGKALWGELKRIPEIRFTSEIRSPGEAFRNLAQTPAKLLPFVDTGAKVSTPKGREELKEHPAEVISDLVSLAAPATRAAGLTYGNAARVTGRAVGKGVVRAAPELAVKIAESPFSKPFRQLPSVRGKTATKALGVASRQVVRELDEASGPYSQTLTSLSTADRQVLKAHLFRGELPEADSPLRPAYEAYSTRIGELAAEGPLRRIPDESHDLLKEQAVARRFDEISRAHGERVAADMSDALKRGLPNPHPELGKPWTRLVRTYGEAVKRANEKFRLEEVEVPTKGGSAKALYSPGSKQVRQLKRAEQAWRAGELSEADFRALAAKVTPAQYRPLTEELERAQAGLRDRLKNETGFGKGAYTKALQAITDDLGYRHWLDLADQGVNPAFVHRVALLPGEKPELGSLFPSKVRGDQPSVLKASAKLADSYMDDPAAMLTHQEFSLIRQNIFARTIPRIYAETGGRPYAQALQEALNLGLSKDQAHRWVRANYRGFDKSTGEVGKALDGELLLPRSVAESMSAYLRQFAPQQSNFDRLLGYWMVPTLWLAPRFHINNIVGGAVLTTVRTSPLAVGRHLKQALRMSREGKLPVEIPTGAVSIPSQFRLDRALSDEAGRAAVGVLRRTGHNILETSRKFNEVMDGMYRGIVYLENMRKGKGFDEAVEAASNVMQNWDALSPLERNTFQRIMPFWGWKRAQLRMLYTLPMDHPYRLAFLNWLSEDIRRQQEEDGLPEIYDNLIPVGVIGPDGKRAYVSVRAMNPFADWGDLLSWRGFIQSLHPGQQAVLRTFGVEPYVGGVPAFGRGQEIDPETGQIRRPIRPRELLEAIPQARAVTAPLGLTEGPPADETRGLKDWYARYGGALGLPSVSYRNPEEAREKYQKALRMIESARKREERKASQGQSTGGFYGSLR